MTECVRSAIEALEEDDLAGEATIVDNYSADRNASSPNSGRPRDRGASPRTRERVPGRARAAAGGAFVVMADADLDRRLR